MDFILYPPAISASIPFPPFSFFQIQRSPVITCSSVSKGSACSAGDLGSIPGLGRSPGEGNGNQLQYPCLESLMDRGAWWAAVHGVAKSRTRLSN